MTSTPPGERTPFRFCANCGAEYSHGARFCHRCGTPVVAVTSQHATSPTRSMATILPWAMAVTALVVVVAAVAMRNSSGSITASPGVPRSQAGSAPDIANMSPSERANRLYLRVMSYAEAGQVDSVAAFAPMVIAAHEMLNAPSIDERYHFGRVAEVVGAGGIAKAQADTILSQRPQSLLGLLLAARAARMLNNSGAAKGYDQRLLAALAAELATNNPDYENHRREIDSAAADARRK